MKLIITVCCLCVFCNLFGQTKKYFRNAFMDVYGICRGMYPISEEQASRTNYYLFEYDTINRLYDVKSCKMDDENGVFSEVLQGIRLTYDFQPGLIQIQTYDYGDDLENLYDPNPFYWEVLLDKNNRVSQVKTYGNSEYDEEMFEEQALVSYLYSKEGKLENVSVAGTNPFYFGMGKNRLIQVKVNEKNQVIEEQISYTQEVEKNDVTRITHQYDAIGNLLVKKAYNKDDDIVANETGACYFEYAFDRNGFLNKKTSFDCFGEKINYTKIDEASNIQTDYPCETEYEYDDLGNLLKISYFNYNHQPFGFDKQVFYTTYTYDSLSNLTSKFNYGVDQQLVLDRFGFAGYRYSYAGIGKMTEKKYFGLAENPVLNEFGVHRITYDYDNYDFKIAENYFDRENNPTTDHSGARRYEFEYYYDEAGYGKTLTKAFGPQLEYLGEDEVIQEGNTQVVYRKIMENNYLVRIESWFDTYKKPISNGEGFHRGEYTYFHEEFISEESYFDTSRQLMLVPKFGFARRTIQYHDTLGHETEIRFFNPKNQLMLNFDSVAVFQYRYDSLLQIIETTQLNEFEQPSKLKTIFYKQLNTFDVAGNLIEVHFLNANLGLMEDRFGIAQYKFTYDGHNMKEKRFYTSKNKLKMDQKGVAIYLFDYDMEGKLLRESYRNAKNKKCITKDSVATIQLQYDQLNRLKEVAAYSEAGKLVETMLADRKCARIEYIYRDEEEEALEMKYYDRANQLLQPR